MQSLGTRPALTWPAAAPSSSSPSSPSPPFAPSPASLASASSLSSASSRSSLRRDVLIRDLGIDQLLVPKNRRPKFELELHIHDLNNVPLVSGSAYVKWHIEGSTRADARGRTSREPIKEHKVAWGYAHACPSLRLSIGRGNVLQEQLIVFEVNQEYSGARERIILGTIKLNLAEYAGVQRETRRYLMQDSKINSTIKITIAMKQVGGDTHYTAPPLKGAQVFSGIAGIIGEQRDQDDTRTMATLNSKNRETGATQDMYRSTLAASWQLQAGELNAEECIEDIFAGGDGWTSSRDQSSFLGNAKPKSVRLFDSSGTRRPDGSMSDSDSTSATSAITPTTPGPASLAPLSAATAGRDMHGKRGKDSDALSIRTVMTSTSSRGRKLSSHSVRPDRSFHEVDEVDVRPDLVSWRMPSAVR